MENIKVPQTTLVYPRSGSIVIRIIRNREVLLFFKSGKQVQDLNTPYTSLGFDRKMGITVSERFIQETRNFSKALVSWLIFISKYLSLIKIGVYQI